MVQCLSKGGRWRAHSVLATGPSHAHPAMWRGLSTHEMQKWNPTGRESGNTGVWYPLCVLKRWEKNLERLIISNFILIEFNIFVF